MTLLKEIASTPEKVMELSVHELAWLVLDFMQHRNVDTSGNLHASLFQMYESDLRKDMMQYKAKSDLLRNAFAEATNWLVFNGLAAIKYESTYNYHIISRRGLEINSQELFENYLRELNLNPDALHPIIRDKAWPSYVRGDFDTAIFDAYKQIEVAVRAKGKFTNKNYGADLMRAAFRPANPKDIKVKPGPLTDTDLEPKEQEAIRDLFVGTNGAFKNPGSHRNVDLDDPAKATELLMFASHLMRIVDEAPGTI